MSRRIVIFAAFACLSVLLMGCGAAQKADKETREQETQAQETYAQSALPSEETKCDLIPAVKVDGKLYYDTGRESDARMRCGVTDGKITEEVDGWKMPEENDQSNFGTGYEYQFVDENALDLFVNGKWFRFEQRGGQ